MPITELPTSLADSFTYAIITGNSEEEVNALVEWYFTQYPVQAYQTKVVKELTDLGGGLYEAKMVRYSSCD